MAVPKELHRVGAGQLFCLLFLSRFLLVLAVNSRFSDGGSILDNILSELAAFAANFLLVLPVWAMHRRRPGLDLLDQAYLAWGKAAVAVCLFYALYLVAVNWYYLSLFQLYIGNVIEVRTPVWVVAAGVLVMACYGALRGVEAILRASGVILAALCAGLVFIVALLLPKMDPLHFEPLLYHGPQQALSGLVLFLSHNTGIVSLGLLLPLVRGRKKLGFVVWNTGICVTLAVLLVVIVGVAGDYLEGQLFPVYTASAMAEAGPFQRLDAFYLGMWMMGLFMKVSFDLYLISYCITKCWNERAGKLSIFAAAVFIAAGAQLSVVDRAVQGVLHGLWFFGTLSAVATLALPLLVQFSDRWKAGRAARKGGAG